MTRDRGVQKGIAAVSVDDARGRGHSVPGHTDGEGARGVVATRTFFLWRARHYCWLEGGRVGGV
jgi:hypothetical protein